LEEVERLIVTSESLLELEKHEKQIKNIKKCMLSQNLESVTQRLKVDLDEKKLQ
jgi:hypothetical protein